MQFRHRGPSTRKVRYRQNQQTINMPDPHDFFIIFWSLTSLKVHLTTKCSGEQFSVHVGIFFVKYEPEVENAHAAESRSIFEPFHQDNSAIILALNVKRSGFRTDFERDFILELNFGFYDV